MSKRARARPQRSKRARRIEPTLFTEAAECPATAEAVAAYGGTNGDPCPLCQRPARDHHAEAADVIRDDRGDFGAWMLSLPRHPY